MIPAVVEEVEVEASIVFAARLIEFATREALNPRVAAFGLLQSAVALAIVARRPPMTIAETKAAWLKEMGRYFDNAIERKRKEL